MEALLATDEPFQKLRLSFISGERENIGSERNVKRIAVGVTHRLAQATKMMWLAAYVAIRAGSVRYSINTARSAGVIPLIRLA